MSFAYVTLLSNSAYLPGVLALANSLKRVNTTYPLLIMSNLALSLEAQSELIKKNCQIITTPPLPLSKEFVGNHSRHAQHSKTPFLQGVKPSFHNPINNFNKLYLWTLEDYKKLVFIDADIIVLQNIDRLFDYPEGSAAPNLYEKLSDFGRMNSGLFVAKPSNATFNKMLKALDTPGAYWPRTDQTFLQSFWPNWHSLPFFYNTLQYLYFNIPELWQWKNIKTIHYQYEKPWDKEHNKREQLKPLIDLWWAMYDDNPIPNYIKEYLNDPVTV